MDRPSAEDGQDRAAALRQTLVDSLKVQRLVRSPPVEAAFRAVPRHLFLPDVPLETAYRDEAVMTKLRDGLPISSSSQPAIMAIMLEQLALAPGMRVLEIGAGTGYNAALIAATVGEAGRVVTVDIDDDLVRAAQDHLAAAGFERVQVVCADGVEGYPPEAPYDRIILTVGAADISPAWFEQLQPGGRLVLPLSIRGSQKCIAFERRAGHLESLSVADCGFMPLRGDYAPAHVLLSLGPDPGLRIQIFDGRSSDAESLYRLLEGPVDDRPTGVTVKQRELLAAFGLWLALHQPGLCFLTATDQAAERHILPELLTLPGPPGRYGAVGALGERSLALLIRPEGRAAPEAAEPFELIVRCYGPDEGLADRLVTLAQDWDRAGRPSSRSLQLSAHFGADAPATAAGEVVVPMREGRLVVDWRQQ